MNHNHITRDIKPKGQCPACDEYHNKRSPKKLTKWESGQEITMANDALLRAIKELKKSDYIELQIACEKARELLVEAYEDCGLVKEMGFGI